MYRETMGMIKGIGVGIAAAAAVTAVGAKMMKDNKRLRRSVHRAMDAAGRDGVVCALGSLYMAGEVRALFPKVKG